MRFFDENGLSTEGLSREDVKAVYRDITTQCFTYDKTAEVIRRSVPGVEISQREPTPEELEELWNSRDLTASPFAPLDYPRLRRDGGVGGDLHLVQRAAAVRLAVQGGREG